MALRALLQDAEVLHLCGMDGETAATAAAAAAAAAAADVNGRAAGESLKWTVVHWLALLLLLLPKGRKRDDMRGRREECGAKCIRHTNAAFHHTIHQPWSVCLQHGSYVHRFALVKSLI
jgi:hypothetical protein